MFHLNASASALRQMLACSPPLAAYRRLLSTRPERLIAAYRVRKPEALLELSVRHAKFRSVGAQGNFFAPAAEGSVRLALSPAGGAPPPGAAFPPYDYAGKIYVDVSALDIVTVIQSPIAQPIMVGYVDSSARGGRQVERRLDIAPAPAGAAAGAGAAAAAPRAPAPTPIALTITNDATSFTITLQQQELYLLRNLLGLSIPYLTGWQYQLLPSSFDPALNLTTSRASSEDEQGGGMGEEIQALPPQQPAAAARQQQYQQPPQQQQQQQQQLPQRGGYTRR